MAVSCACSAGILAGVLPAKHRNVAGRDAGATSEKLTARHFGSRLSSRPSIAFPPTGRYADGMSAFPVSPEKETQLAQRMSALGVREADIEETFVRSGGHGGQNVNKCATCVQLIHRPTRLHVKCQETRQQGLNRFLARRLLLDKIEALQKGFVDAERAAAERIRRQKRRRSRRSKQRMLADKSHQAAKKESRRPIAGE